MPGRPPKLPRPLGLLAPHGGSAPPTPRGESGGPSFLFISSKQGHRLASPRFLGSCGMGPMPLAGAAGRVQHSSGACGSAYDAIFEGLGRPASDEAAFAADLFAADMTPRRASRSKVLAPLENAPHALPSLAPPRHAYTAAVCTAPGSSRGGSRRSSVRH